MDINFNGEDSFVYRVNDTDDTSGTGNMTAQETVTITILPIDDTPVATPISISISEDLANDGVDEYVGSEKNCFLDNDGKIDPIKIMELAGWE